MDSNDLIIAGLIVFLITTVILAAQKRFVVYFDGSDLFVSVLTWLFFPVTFLFSRLFGLSETFTTVLLVIAGIGTVICFFASFAMCCHYNKSILAGLFVGLFKILFAAFGILLFIGMIFSAPDNKRNSDSGCLFILLLIAFGLFGYLAKCLVNGPAVYLNNQWAIPSDADESNNEKTNINDGDENDDDNSDDDDTEDDLDTAYEILGVSKDASDEEIKQAYTKQVKESHPDKLPPNTPEWVLKIAQEKFADLQKAYKIVCEARK